MTMCKTNATSGGAGEVGNIVALAASQVASIARGANS